MRHYSRAMLNSSFSQELHAVNSTWFEKVFGFFTILLYQGAFISFITGRADQDMAIHDATAHTTGGDPRARALMAVVFAILLIIIAIRRQTVIPVILSGKSFFLLIALCLVSTTWSVDSFLTLHRAVSLIGVILFAYYAYAVFGQRTTVRLLTAAMAAGAVASLVTAVIAPSFAFDVKSTVTQGSLVGIFPQKNELSIAMLFGLCGSLYLGFIATDKSKFDRMTKLSIPLFILTLLLSHGVTSMLAMLVIILIAVSFIIGIKSRYGLIIPFFAGAVLLISVTAMLVDPKFVFNLAGKDPTLTGRWPIWLLCFDAIGQRPLLGYGFDAFWSPQSLNAQYIWDVLRWEVPSAHNGFIELLLDLGVIGLSLYLFVIARLLQLTIRAVRSGELDEMRWLALFMAAMLIENLDEGTLAKADLMMVQVVFGTALAEAWWLDYRSRVKEGRVYDPTSTWSERFSTRSAASTILSVRGLRTSNKKQSSTNLPSVSTLPIIET